MADETNQVQTQSRKSAFFKLACVLAFAYLFFLIILYSPLYQSIVLRPDYQPDLTYSPQPILGISPKETSIISGQSKMHAWLFPVPKSKTLVLVHHGNAGNLLNRLFIAEACIQAGASVLLYDYRGYGKSQGVAALENLLADGLVAFDFVKNNYQYPVVINYGESIGSAVATYVDSQRQANGLILQSGIASLPKVARAGIVLLSLYPDFIWPPPLLDDQTLLSQSKTPLLLIHGERDTVVPINNSSLLNTSAKAADKSFIRLPDCGHNDVGLNDRNLYLEAISSFIHKINAGKTAN